MLKAIPTTAHLARMYHELAKIGAASAGANRPWPYRISSKEELLALACDMSRFDPRLFNILAGYFIAHWQEINPTALRGLYKKMECPQTVAVIGEFLTEVADDSEADSFAKYLMSGLKAVPPQFYFHDLYAPGGKLAERAVEEGLYEFKKWGFFACERPVTDMKEKGTSGTLDIASRRNILRRLLQDKKEIVLSDYLAEVNDSVSRQQALIDIKSSGLAQSHGSGRGAKWKLAA